MLGAAILGLIKQGIKLHSKRKDALNQREIERINNASSWELAAMKHSGVWLRRVSFGLFAFPIILTAYNPDAGAQLFANLETAPDWYVKTFVAINGGVWGIIELKRFVPSVLGAFKR